jgi:Zn finger protein HypA/HybF involved in hydrogenase expression
MSQHSRHFGRIDPDDPPEARCGDCGSHYNPYKHGLGECPHCADGSNDVPVVDPSSYVD